MRKTVLVALAMAMLVIGLFLGRFYVARNTHPLSPVPEPIETFAPTEIPQPTPTEVIPPSAKRIAALKDFFRSLPKECSAAYLDIGTGESVSVRGDTPKYSASIYELVLLLGVGQAVAEGRLTLDTLMDSGRTVSSDLYLAITQSDNEAA